MEIKVRNIPEDVLLQIGYKAKKEGVSREEYLRKLIKENAEADILSAQQNIYKDRLDSLIAVFEENNRLMDALASHYGIEIY